MINNLKFKSLYLVTYFITRKKSDTSRQLLAIKFSSFSKTYRNNKNFYDSYTSNTILTIFLTIFPIVDEKKLTLNVKKNSLPNRR